MARVTVVANAHARGGGEISSATLIRMIAARRHAVTFRPTGKIGATYRIPSSVVVGPPLASAAPERCDVLLFYANDAVYKLEEQRSHWEGLLKAAGRVVVCLNFVLGQATLPWFAEMVDAVIFLNSTKCAEFVGRVRAFSGEVIVLPPPVDLEPFLAVSPDYSRVSFVRHGRYAGKYDEIDTMVLLDRARAIFPMADFWFMAAPPFLRTRVASDLRIHGLAWDQVPVPEFLSQGSAYWYRLPPSLRDQGPRVLVEAMAAGLPCIVDNRDGAKDRVTSDAGWLCETTDDYVAAMMEIEAHPEVLRIKGRHARERARREFNPGRWIDAVLGARGQRTSEAPSIAPP